MWISRGRGTHAFKWSESDFYYFSAPQSSDICLFKVVSRVEYLGYAHGELQGLGSFVSPPADNLRVAPNLAHPPFHLLRHRSDHLRHPFQEPFCSLRYCLSPITLTNDIGKEDNASASQQYATGVEVSLSLLRDDLSQSRPLLWSVAIGDGVDTVLLHGPECSWMTGWIPQQQAREFLCRRQRVCQRPGYGE
jgi:hypothetical protein